VRNYSHSDYRTLGKSKPNILAKLLCKVK